MMLGLSPQLQFTKLAEGGTTLNGKGVYISTKFNVLGINCIVGMFRCMIYVIKSMVHVVFQDYLGYSLVNWASFVYFL